MNDAFGYIGNYLKWSLSGDSALYDSDCHPDCILSSEGGSYCRAFGGHFQATIRLCIHLWRDFAFNLLTSDCDPVFPPSDPLLHTITLGQHVEYAFLGRKSVSESRLLTKLFFFFGSLMRGSNLYPLGVSTRFSQRRFCDLVCQSRVTELK